MLHIRLMAGRLTKRANKILALSLQPNIFERYGEDKGYLYKGCPARY